MMSRFIDLSHAIESGAPGYPGLPAPRIEPYISHAASRASYGDLAEFEISRVFMIGNTGTYLDSPYHRWKHGADIAELPISGLAGLSGFRLDAAGAIHGPVVAELPTGIKGSAVLVNTGWSGRWGSKAYWQAGPYLGRALVDAVLRAGVSLVGVDFWNVDDTRDPARPAHTRLLEAGVLIVEHLTGLDALPPAGFRFFAVPAPIRGAASFPVRAYAEVLEPAMGQAG